MPALDAGIPAFPKKMAVSSTAMMRNGGRERAKNSDYPVLKPVTSAGVKVPASFVHPSWVPEFPCGWE
jgi:hypothetical protein